MAESLEDVDPSVGFLYKTMLQRDPRKRRVKPVKKHLLQLDFGGLDSSDDSDYEVVNNAEGSDSDIESDADEDDDEGSDEGSSSDEEEEEDAEEEEEKVEEEISIGALLEQAVMKNRTAKLGSEETTTSGSSSGKLKVLICSVCLGDISDEEDEIVECDGCGVSVHEGCYGIGESLSVASTESSASTEPWFCDACKAGVKPNCELCPNSGGIFKETDSGRWVHIICALYVPGVAFGDVDKLTSVTLFEMPYSKWGAKECSFCEDPRFSRTGVCIGCDAGMCRNYFHVTCAQKEGLCSEANPEEEIADPFYAYCKQHAEKNSARAKRRNWLAIQSYYKNHKDNNTPEQEKQRVFRKLNRHRQKYIAARAKRPPSWVPKEKMPRMLNTSPSALRLLMRKAELLGINTQMEAQANKVEHIRKKWNVPPALSIEFVGYYLDRNLRMVSMKTHLKDLINQHDKLQEQERILRSKYDELSSEVAIHKDSISSLREKGEEIWKMLSTMAGKQLPLPEVIKPKKVVRPLGKRDTPKSPPALIHQCAKCGKNHDQHLLTKCDKCSLYYHLGCLDPPLTRMPKKTKLMGWQCAECAASSSEEQKAEVNLNPDAPRRLREKIKEPVKFEPDKEHNTSGADRARAKGRRKRLLQKRKRQEKDEEEEEKEMPVLKRERPIRLPKPNKNKDIRTECTVCSLPGDNNNLVRCDECKLCYHFHCLDPPLRKSPKVCGYAWLCTACDPLDGDSSNRVARGILGPRVAALKQKAALKLLAANRIRHSRTQGTENGTNTEETLGSNGQSSGALILGNKLENIKRFAPEDIPLAMEVDDEQEEEVIEISEDEEEPEEQDDHKIKEDHKVDRLSDDSDAK